MTSASDVSTQECMANCDERQCRKNFAFFLLTLDGSLDKNMKNMYAKKKTKKKLVAASFLLAMTVLVRTKHCSKLTTDESEGS